MKEIRITAEELGKLLVMAYREWLKTAPLEEIVSVATARTIGVYLSWWDDDEDGTAENLRICLFITSAETNPPSSAVDGPDFAGHLPYVPLVGTGNWDQDIDDVLAEWGAKLPEDDEDEDEDDDGEASRVWRFESFLFNTPGLLSKARRSLARKIDDTVKDDFVVFAEVWLDAQRRKLVD